MAAFSICSPWIAGPYNMHATALNALTEWGRVHEVRRPQPKLSRALIQIGVSPFCRWDSRGALLTRSFARFRHFAFVSRTGLSLSWAAFRGCLAPVAGRGNAVCWLLRWLLKSGGLGGPSQSLIGDCLR